MIRKLIRQIRESAAHMKIRTQLLVLLFSGVFAAFFLYQLLWQNKWPIYDFIVRTTDWLPVLSDDVFYNLRARASDYNLPASEGDQEAIEALEPYFDLIDDYTSVSVYGLEDGLYRTGSYAPLLKENTNFRRMFDIWYSLSDGNGEEYYSIPAEFKNGYATLDIRTYHRSVFLFPWFLISLSVSFLLFLMIILLFVGHKMKLVSKLETDVLRMSSGDLITPVQTHGYDEIGILSLELDQLRLALLENIRQEQESRTANHDLITAMSHDLRTPLTILNGYLEIVSLGKNPQMQEDYLKRCLEKAKDIREMTDRMFEYSLVYESAGAVDLQPVPLSELFGCLRENLDYIRLTGFTVRTDFPAFCMQEPENGQPQKPAAVAENPADPDAVLADRAMIKRIFGNLFSNIIKYGDKKEPVILAGSIKDSGLHLTLSNYVKKEYAKTDSTCIGLKSVRKMLEQMDGSFETDVCGDCFKASLSFCITDLPL